MKCLLLVIAAAVVVVASSSDGTQPCESYESIYDCLSTRSCFWCDGIGCVTPPSDSSEWTALSDSSNSSLENIHWLHFNSTNCSMLCSDSSSSSDLQNAFSHWYYALIFFLFLCCCTCCAGCRSDSRYDGYLFVKPP